MTDFKLLIDGDLVDGDHIMDDVNPATGRTFTQVARASEEQANQAVAAAKRAFDNWAATPLAERQNRVNELADKIAASVDELAQLITTEQGKPLAESSAEVAWSEGYLRYYATLEPSHSIIQDDDDFRVEVKREPLGVVAGIVPWNFPLLIACWKLGPALVAGNTIVIKSSPTTPATSLALGALCQDVFPPGVVNVITDDNDLGPLLTAHPDIAKVSFTGSAATGKKVAANGSATLKRLTLELGGNDAAVVLDDVDVDSVAAGIYQCAFMNSGQVCLAIKRAYIHEAIYDEMCAALAMIAESAIVGDGMREDTTHGPMQNEAQYNKVLELLDSAKEDGKIVSGGDAMEGDGYFIRPTIVRDVSDGQRIVDEEQFGPVLPLVRFSDIDDVLAKVNASDYGLGGSVWSANPERAAEIASRVESGTVWVNQHLNIGPNVPMAGHKQSGIGVEQSQEGLDEYTKIKVIHTSKAA